jgi:hypothetical protein
MEVVYRLINKGNIVTGAKPRSRNFRKFAVRSRAAFLTRQVSPEECLREPVLARAQGVVRHVIGCSLPSFVWGSLSFAMQWG